MSQKFLTDIELEAGLKDNSNGLGTSGQVLSSTGSGVSWIDQSGGTSGVLSITVKNISGGTLTAGTAVCATSPSQTPPQGIVVEVIAADYDNINDMPAIGILKEDLNNAAEGEAVMMGSVTNINTNSFNISDELYVGAGGALVNSKPTTAGQFIQKIAVVVKKHSSNGVIKVIGAGRANDVPLPLYIDNLNQRVGISEPTPDYELHVNGQIYSESDNYPVYYLKRNTTATGGSFSTLTGIASAFKLETVSSGTITDAFGGGIIFSIGDTNPNTAARIYARRDGGDQTGALQFWGGANGGTLFTTMRASGNVGIGTESPAEKLVVSEDRSGTGAAAQTKYTLVSKSTISSGTPGTGGIKVVYDDGANEHGFGLVSGSSSADFLTSGPMHFYTNSDLNTNSATGFAMVIDTSQQVGIGTSSPSSKLEIVDDLSAASTVEYPLTLSVKDDNNSIDQQGGEGVGIKFKIAGNDTTDPGNTFVGAGIAAVREVTTDTDSSTALAFSVSQNDETLDEVVRIDHDGNVGILETNPAHPLHITKNSGGSSESTSQLKIAYDPTFRLAISHRGYFFGPGNNDYRFYRDNDLQMIIKGFSDNSNYGYVGLGTTNPERDFQIKKATDGGQVRAEVNNSSNTANSHGVVSIYTAGDDAGDPFAHWKINSDPGTDWSMGIDNSDADKLKISKNFGPGTNDYLTITTGGLVGIGTTSPDALLDIGTNNIITLDDTGSSTGFIGMGSYNDGTKNRAQGTSYYGFGLEIDRPNELVRFNSYDSNGIISSGTNILVLKRDGKVGIGTNDPLTNLHISSGTSGDATVIIEADTDNNQENDLPRLWFKADQGITEGAIQLNDNEFEIISNVSLGGDIVFKTGTTDNTGTTDPATGATERARITSTGVEINGVAEASYGNYLGYYNADPHDYINSASVFYWIKIGSVSASNNDIKFQAEINTFGDNNYPRGSCYHVTVNKYHSQSGLSLSNQKISGSDYGDQLSLMVDSSFNIWIKRNISWSTRMLIRPMVLDGGATFNSNYTGSNRVSTQPSGTPVLKHDGAFRINYSSSMSTISHDYRYKYFNIDGDNKMTILNSGDIGIDNSSPSFKLDIGSSLNDSDAFRINGVYSNVLFSANVGTPTGGVGLWNFINTGTNATTRFYVQDANNASDRLTFRFTGNGGSKEILSGTSTGLIGIGTNAPSRLLHLKADSAASIITLQRGNANSGGSYGALQWTASDNHTVAAVDARADGDNEGAHLLFHTTSAATSDNPYGINERMRIDSNGLVSISNSGVPTLRLNNTDTSLGLQTLGSLEFYQNDPSGGGVGAVAKINVVNESTFQGQGAFYFYTGTTSALQETVKIFNYDGGSAYAGNIIINSQPATGWAPGDGLGKITFHTKDLSGIGERDIAVIEAVSNDGNDSTTTTMSGALSFKTSVYNGNVAETFKLLPTGEVQIRTSGNANGGCKINFSDHQGGSFAQNGTLEYVHADGSSYGSGNAFKLYGNQPSMSFVVDGKTFSDQLILGTTSSQSHTLYITEDLTSTVSSAHFDSARATTSTYGAVNVRVKNVEYGSGMRFYRQGPYGTSAISFVDDNGTQRGTIIIGSTGTTYNETSDYRLKENVIELTNGIERVKQLQPKRFNFIGDEETVDGFIAHEAGEVVPESVTGEKDAVLPNGDPEYQGMDKAKLVPLLTAALQEAIAKIEDLETRIENLENN